jgi:hypothetical protein
MFSLTIYNIDNNNNLDIDMDIILGIFFVIAPFGLIHPQEKKSKK